MAKRTKDQMITYIKQDFIRDDLDDEILVKLNDTIRWMAGNHDFTELNKSCYFTTVVGQPDYALPTDLNILNHPITLLDDSSGNGRAGSYQMDHISWEDYRRREPNPKTSQTPNKGKPTAYAIRQDAVWLTPIPDLATYKIEVDHNAFPTPLSGGSDYHPFKESDEEMLKAGTLERLYRDTLKLPADADEQSLNFFYGYYNAQTGERQGGWKSRTANDISKKEPAQFVRPRYF